MKPTPVWATTCRSTASHVSSIAFPTGAGEAAEAPAGGGTGFDPEHPAMTSARPASQEARGTRGPA
jgi:hypothetical protein